MNKPINKQLTILAAIVFSALNQFSHAQNVGASLNDKSELKIPEIPKEVVAIIKSAHPEVKITGAEKEQKHGKTYIDVETEDAKGNELEFDMLLGGKGWEIVEIQRDLLFKNIPKPVQQSFKQHLPNIAPARIIESDQGDGVVIYEFFIVSENGKESKHEIKLSQGKAKLLGKEWTH